MALTDVQTKRTLLNTAIADYQSTLVGGDPIAISAAKLAAQQAGDALAKEIGATKKASPELNDDEFFSNPARMNALVRDDIKTIMTTGKLFGAGMKLLMDTEGVTPGATNVILAFAEGSAIDVDWGDGSSIQSYTGAASHDYVTPGQYTVEVHGTVNGFTAPLLESRQQLKDVMQWGEVQFASAAQMFRIRTGFVISASDGPTFLPGASCAQMFRLASDFNSNIDHWDMSNVVDMKLMFYLATNFNQPLTSWNVSNVVNMEQMFSQATSFNQPLNSWNVSSLLYMLQMFREANAFNQPLNGWNTANVTSMNSVFYRNSIFNQPLNNWDVSNVTDMTQMFYLATAFNQNLSGWTVGQVTDFSIFNSGGIIQANYLPNF